MIFYLVTYRSFQIQQLDCRISLHDIKLAARKATDLSGKELGDNVNSLLIVVWHAKVSFVLWMNDALPRRQVEVF